MGLLVLVVVLALLAGRVCGGRLAELARVRPRAGWLALGAGALLAVSLAWGALATPLTAAAAALAGGFLLCNRRLAGLALVGLGLAANALVVAVNGAMPVSTAAAARAGVHLSGLPGDTRHARTGPHTELGLLGDVVPVALPLRPEVASPGDLMVAAGVGLFLFRASGATPGKVTAWRRKRASGGPAPSGRPTTASVRTPS